MILNGILYQKGTYVMAPGVNINVGLLIDLIVNVSKTLSYLVIMDSKMTVEEFMKEIRIFYY